MELHHPVPHLPPLNALVSGRADILVLPFFSNERPLCGLGGKVDWECRGQMSRWIQSNAATGTAGEWIWMPLFRASPLKPAKILWLGSGESSEPGRRQAPAMSLQKRLQESLARETGRLVWTPQEWGGWEGPKHLPEGLERVDLD